MTTRAPLVALVFALTTPVALRAQAAMDSVRALWRAGVGDSALAYARAQVAAAPNDPWAHHALARAALRLNDLATAVTEAERTVALAPNDSRHQALLGDVYLEKASDKGGLGALGLARKGKAALERAVALDPDNLDARESLVGFNLEAPGIAGGDKAEAGRQALEIARRSRVRGAAAQLRVALETEKEFDITYAFEQAAALVVAGSDSLNLLRNGLLGAALRVKKDALKEKLTARLYEVQPADPFVQYARARLWVIQGKQLPQAITLLQSYVALPAAPAGGASMAGAHWRLGQAYEKSGRETDALAEYRRAVQLDPRLEPAKKDADRLGAKLKGR